MTEISKKNQNETAINIVHGVLERAKMNPEPIAGESGFTIILKEEDSPTVKGSAFIVEDEDRFLFYLDIPEKAPKERLSSVAEFIARANFGLSIGNFELDYDTGVIRFKASFDYHGGELLPVYVSNAILAAMDGIEAYASNLLAVMAGKKTPQQAITDAENFIV